MDRTKLLKPWQKHSSEDRYFRSSTTDISTDISITYAIVIYQPIKRGSYASYWYGTETGDKKFPTKEAAMAATDEILIENGYVLLKEGQWEKIQTLL